MFFLIGLLKPQSRQQYVLALQIFADWVSAMFPSFWNANEEEQDFALSEYTLECRDREQCGAQFCSTTISAVSRVYGKRRRYGAASLTVEGWKAGMDVRQAPPMPASVAYAIGVLLTVLGKLDVAAAVLLCFTGLMRISEALSLTMGDVLLPAEHESGPFILVLLRSGKRDAPDATRIIIGVPAVVAWVQLYNERARRGRESKDLFCDVSYSTFRKWMRRTWVARLSGVLLLLAQSPTWWRHCHGGGRLAFD